MLSTPTIVPDLELKLGGRYAYPLVKGNIVLDAGWMWVNYFGAVVNDNFNLRANQIVINHLNFGLQGLFFGLKWQEN